MPENREQTAQMEIQLMNVARFRPKTKTTEKNVLHTHTQMAHKVPNLCECEPMNRAHLPELNNKKVPVLTVKMKGNQLKS